ncbi:MAG TPA: UbiX family flavin prenyltransferase [Candidatus Limnocylindrales bacterium]|nr:UbiX family flavin prenyltransferase [Candidatus Limnocylindrales bacterium]
MKRRIIVGITGASGVIYGIRLLEILRQQPKLEVHLIISKEGERRIEQETDWEVEKVKALAHVFHNNQDIGASIASGSFRTLGMILVPCSRDTLFTIANCLSDTLISRAADVVLKEKRKLALLIQETPLSPDYLKDLLAVVEMGALVFFPAPAFYTQPRTIEDVVNQTLGRVLDYFEIDYPLLPRWKEKSPKARKRGLKKEDGRIGA